MLRKAIVVTLSSAALVLSCTQDFDGLFAPSDGKTAAGDDASKPKPGASSSGGATSGDAPKPGACGTPVAKCVFAEDQGAVSFSRTCTGCGCSCGTLECAPGREDCRLGCLGGSQCATVCDAKTCSLTAEGATGKLACAADRCDVQCQKGASCIVDCSDTVTCTVAVDGTSTAVVTCGPKTSCNVTCAKGDAKRCADGVRACGECPG